MTLFRALITAKPNVSHRIKIAFERRAVYTVVDWIMRL